MGNDFLFVSSIIFTLHMQFNEPANTATQCFALIFVLQFIFAFEFVFVYILHLHTYVLVAIRIAMQR